MSLASLLIRKKSVDVDSGLDAIFRSSAGPSKVANDVQSEPSSSKSPLKAEKAKSLKRKTSVDEKDDKVGPKLGKKKKHSKKGDAVKITESESAPKLSKKKKAKGLSEDSEPEDINGDSDDDELEKQHLSARTTKSAPPLADDGQDDSESDEGAESTELPVHESVGKRARKTNTKGSKLKYVPEDETWDQRDARTVFVGNIPTEVVKSRPMLKQLKRHLLSHVPGAHIESTRFRSVAFKNPTAKLESEDAKGKGTASAESTSTKQQRQKERASTWREQHDGEDTEGKSDAKTYMTPQEKRKVAFIKGEVHEQADSVNVYVVFAHPIPDELWPSNVPKRESISPYEAAKLAVKTCDGTTVFDRTIRVDLAGRDGVALTSDGKVGVPIGTDPRLSVFVGNLDFASKEEDLRVFFEGLLSAERGAPSDDDDDGENRNAKPPKTWVTRVRIVKDRDTQLGKGFAYVQFADRECVDEMLAMEQEKLKFAKRKLRVQRCKTVPSSGMSSEVRSGDQTSSSSTPGRRTSIAGVPKPTPIIPKGDPSLGERLAGLPKEVRKQTKASDADRVARRLAKKKARNALEKAGVKTQSKVRSRERTQKVAGPAGKKISGRKEGKGRVRSDKSIAKRNMKKQ